MRSIPSRAVELGVVVGPFYRGEIGLGLALVPMGKFVGLHFLAYTGGPIQEERKESTVRKCSPVLVVLTREKRYTESIEQDEENTPFLYAKQQQFGNQNVTWKTAISGGCPDAIRSQPKIKISLDSGLVPPSQRGRRCHV